MAGLSGRDLPGTFEWSLHVERMQVRTLFEKELPNGHAANFCCVISPRGAMIVSDDFEPAAQHSRSG